MNIFNTNFNSLICRLNRKAKFQLEKDLKDKFSVLSIDEYCEQLKNNSPNIDFKEGTAKIEAK